MSPRPARLSATSKAVVIVPEPASLSLPALTGGWAWVAMLAALVEPAAGIVLWLFYAPQSQARSRRLGWVFLGLALLGGILEAAFGKSAEGLAERSIQSYY